MFVFVFLPISLKSPAHVSDAVGHTPALGSRLAPVSTPCNLTCCKCRLWDSCAKRTHKQIEPPNNPGTLLSGPRMSFCPHMRIFECGTPRQDQCFQPCLDQLEIFIVFGQVHVVIPDQIFIIVVTADWLTWSALATGLTRAF